MSQPWAASHGRVTYYVIAIFPAQLPSRQHFVGMARDGLYLGKDCRVTASSSAAMIATRDIAEEFLAARIDHMRKLYGDSTSMEVQEVSVPEGNTPRQRAKLAGAIEGNTRRVIARLREKVFAPNVLPASEKLQK